MSTRITHFETLLLRNNFYILINYFHLQSIYFFSQMQIFEEIKKISFCHNINITFIDYVTEDKID